MVYNHYVRLVCDLGIAKEGAGGVRRKQEIKIC